MFSLQPAAHFAAVTFACALVFAAVPLSSVLAQTPPPAASAQIAPGKNPTQTLGRYTVELRLPAGGVFAGEETDLEFHLSDTGRPDPVLGPPAVIRAKITGTVTMPIMPSMPASKPAFHAEGVPGDYGLVTNFAHGGDFLITLQIQPPTENEAFTVSFPVTVQDAQSVKGRKPAPAPYTLQIESAPYRFGAGETATLTLTVKNRATGETVKNFDELHTVPMHLILVKDDLSAFFHEHPTLNPDGTLTQTFSFPTAGTWRVWADCAPRNAGEMPLAAQIDVSGVRPLRVSLPQPTSGAVRSDNGSVLATMKTRTLVARQTQTVSFALADGRGGEVNDLQPWLGAIAHLIAVDKDGQSYVHAHPDEADPRNGRGGVVSFLARFPKAGTYKLWLQFQRAGSVVTIPFVVRVNENK